MTPREAFLGPQDVVAFGAAEGRVAAESLAAYPPGIPNVLPGERLTRETLDYIDRERRLRRLRARGDRPRAEHAAGGERARSGERAGGWGVDSEHGRLLDVLLCPPDNFRWLPTSAISRATLESGRRFDAGAAAAQHAELVSVYEGAGVRCHFLEPDPALPYQVFARDSSVMTPWGPVVTQLQQWWRRGEYAPVLRFYEGAGIPVFRMVTAAALEGGDVMIVEPGSVADRQRRDADPGAGGPAARGLVRGERLGGPGGADPGPLRPHRRARSRSLAEQAGRRLHRGVLSPRWSPGCARRASS